MFQKKSCFYFNVTLVWNYCELRLRGAAAVRRCLLTLLRWGFGNASG